MPSGCIQGGRILRRWRWLSCLIRRCSLIGYCSRAYKRQSLLQIARAGKWRQALPSKSTIAFFHYPCISNHQYPVTTFGARKPRPLLVERSCCGAELQTAIRIAAIATTLLAPRADDRVIRGCKGQLVDRDHGQSSAWEVDPLPETGTAH